MFVFIKILSLTFATLILLSQNNHACEDVLLDSLGGRKPIDWRVPAHGSSPLGNIQMESLAIISYIGAQFVEGNRIVLKDVIPKLVARAASEASSSLVGAIKGY